MNTITHPLAWWAWAAGAAVAIMRIGEPTVTMLLLLAVVLVALACRADTPWARAFPVALALGVVIVVLRVGFYVVVGLGDSSPVLWDLPEIPLPGWFTNLTLLGPVHADGLRQAATAGLTLATLVITFGAVNAVANPRLALRSLPASLHHLGAAAVIAVSVTPQLLSAIVRVRRAQRLRGAPARGLRAFTARLVPVLAGALDQALDLAASMDARGYARAHRGGGTFVTVALVVALAAAVGGTYALLDVQAPRPLAVVLLAMGVVLAVAGSVAASRAVVRTRYRRQPWDGRAWLVSGAGLVAAVLAVAVTAAARTTWPVALPGQLPLVLGGVAALVVALPAVIGPAEREAR
ncbi:energy-coupling factor transporter transmembrane component T [Ruania halotolerans]|uniref:energy-coupling factor transporter transmembrane component T n=1 Tax=Ruania halotolerans TaxID=2897773 RepID=UPI001E536AAD|nr:energy-coupling factor transporter transmembrane component T [Ruania halotolerans]UFU07709.1 energy-coupling factor transporter transmembrane protein EcfT [Ruania halotolerans]